MTTYHAKILLDSMSKRGDRLTTFELSFPRFLLAEINTHKVLSRNAQSSRAIPVEKRIAAVENDPFIPEAFSRNRPGMQADEALEGDQAHAAEIEWRRAIDDAVRHARALAVLGVHKQHANRVLEPYAHVSCVLSGTHWSNFFALRTHPDAQPEFQRLAVLMRRRYEESKPDLLDDGFWHLPYVDITGGVRKWHRANAQSEEMAYISAGRCARVSRSTFDGLSSFPADLELIHRILGAGHVSPTEHPALAGVSQDHMSSAHCDGNGSFWSGNYRGWTQLRKTIANEDDYSRLVK